MQIYKKNIAISILITINFIVFMGGILLVKTDLERQTALADGYYKSSVLVSDSQALTKMMQFVQGFYTKEPYELYADFRMIFTSSSNIKTYFSDFYTYYFVTIQNVSNAASIAPPESLFVNYLSMQLDTDYKNLSGYQKLLADAAVPYKTFAVWYTKRTAKGYSKYLPLFEQQDETILSYARNFIERFAERGLPFEYLSRIMALELELLYRSARTVSFWDANQRWDNSVLQKIYKRIGEYKERFADNFSVHQTGAVNWILSMERLVDHEISDRGFFVNNAQKEALERESKLLGAIPGLQVKLLQNDYSAGEIP